MDSKKAFFYFCEDEKVVFEYKALLQEKEFWSTIEDLLSLLSPIHEC